MWKYFLPGWMRNYVSAYETLAKAVDTFKKSGKVDPVIITDIGTYKGEDINAEVRIYVPGR